MVNMNKFEKPSVYGLYATDGVIRYVGSTSKNSLNRLWQHIYRARVGHTGPVYQWMRDVGIENVRTCDMILETNPERRLQLEADIIANLMGAGVPLVNQTSQDGRVHSMSEESRRLIGEKAKGRVTWIKGRKGAEAGWTDERRARLAQRAEERRATRIPNHGTINEYTKYSCRCSDCRSIMREKNRATRELRKTRNAV